MSPRTVSTPCSYQECVNGHRWTPQIAIVGCNGCHAPSLALRMVNCPICNEPVVKTTLRVDHVGGAHPITKVCQHEMHVGPEYIKCEITHGHTGWAVDDNQNPKVPHRQTIEILPEVVEAQTSGT